MKRLHSIGMVDPIKLVITIGALGIIIMLLLSLIFSFKNKSKYVETYKKIYVYEKDTLWNIADQYKNSNQDIREYIYKIKELNKMNTSIIYEGQKLQIIEYMEVK